MKKIFDYILKTCHCERSEAIQNNKMDCHVASAPRNDNNINSRLTTHHSLVKAIAFTLAETLVVMGIIGVVAALTIPNLNQSTGDREKVAKVKKVYANLTDAFGRATAVYGPVDEWCTNLPQNVTCDERVVNRIKEFMKVSKDCGTSTEGCFSKSPLLNVEGDTLFSNYYSSLSGANLQMFTLADGTSIAINVYRDIVGSYIFVDIDGPTKGKNQDGVDIFDFHLEEDGIYPNGHQFVSEGDVGAGDWNDDYSSFPTLWVVQNENLDYLKCADELNWSSKTSCK